MTDHTRREVGGSVLCAVNDIRAMTKRVNSPPRSSDGGNEQQTNGNKDGPHRHAADRACAGAVTGPRCRHTQSLTHNTGVIGGVPPHHRPIALARRPAQAAGKPFQRCDYECQYVLLARAARCEQA